MFRNNSTRKKLLGRPRSIAFFGLFGVTNLGNEASLRTGIAAVKRLEPNARLSCVCHNPVSAERDHEIPSYSIYMGGIGSLSRWPRPIRAATWPLMELGRWLAAYRFLRSIDLLLIPGTGILDDFGVSPWEMPTDLLRWSLLTRVTQTRLAFVGIGAGPIRGRMNRILMRQALYFADSCSYRDEGSLAYMASIGRDTSRDKVVPDIVFALDVPAVAAGTLRTGSIGVGTMAYYGWSNSPLHGEDTYQRYIASIRLIIRGLLERGWEVLLLVGESTDQRAVDDVMAAISENDMHRIRCAATPITTMDDLLQAIAQVDLVVATRYHNVVAALMSGRPVISAGYSRKNDWLVAQFGLEAYCQDVDHLDPRKVLSDLEALSNDLPSRWHSIGARSNDWRSLVEAGFREALAPGVTP